MPLTDGGPISVDDTAGGTLIVAYNGKRRELLICNNDDIYSIWVSVGGTPVVNKGIHLPAGFSLPIVVGDYSEYRGAVKGIADTGATVVVSYTELTA